MKNDDDIVMKVPTNILPVLFVVIGVGNQLFERYFPHFLGDSIFSLFQTVNYSVCCTTAINTQLL